jgi:hypothetical protein
VPQHGRDLPRDYHPPGHLAVTLERKMIVQYGVWDIIGKVGTAFSHSLAQRQLSSISAGPLQSIRKPGKENGDDAAADKSLPASS